MFYHVQISVRESDWVMTCPEYCHSIVSNYQHISDHCSRFTVFQPSRPLQQRSQLLCHLVLLHSPMIPRANSQMLVALQVVPSVFASLARWLRQCCQFG
ncbi:hypothetical protein BgiMline_016505 [Biomphalaria glabrata]|nr:hypothetical protein BgiMline_009310 [Biomphalaria glabrata]